MDTLKNILIVILVLAVVLLFSKQSQHPGATANFTNGKENKPMQYTDPAGTVHTELKVAQGAGIDEMSEHGQHITDSLAKKIGTKTAAIKDVTVVEASTVGSIHPMYYTKNIIDSGGLHFFTQGSNDTLQLSTNTPLASTDTNRQTIISYQDKWLELHGTLHKDSALYYGIYDELSVVGYEKKTGLFSSALYVDVSSANPHTHISGLTGIRVIPKPKQWAIGITAGYCYDGAAIRPGISIGITKTIFRW